MRRPPKLTENREFYKPFRYPWCYDAWLEHEQSHWLHTEVNMADDVYDWENVLSAKEKDFLTKIFRFFTQGDIDVAGAYVNNYLPVFQQPEVRMMLLGFAAREAVHISAYSHLIETLGMPETTYSEFLEYDAMKNKHNYVARFIENDPQTIAQQMAVFSAFTEGMQLFSSFVMLLNFQRHGKMRGMGQIIAWSLRDETMHYENMIKLFKTFVRENRHIWNDSFKKELYDIARDMVDLEDKFVELAFSQGEMEGLTEFEVKQYIRYITDRRLRALSLKSEYHIKKNPLPWVEEMINAPSHTNFFESRSTDYAKGAKTGGWADVWGNWDSGEE